MPDPQDTAQQPTAAGGPQAADTAAPAAATPETETTAEPAVAEEAPQAVAAAARAAPAAPVVPEPAPAVAADVPASEAKPAGRRGPKAPITGPRVRVRQIGSPIGRRRDQRQTLIGLGLNKMHRVRELPDTPAVRGMLDKVRHLVEVESVG